MKIVLIDVSGSMVSSLPQIVKKKVQPNDFVILFDDRTKSIGLQRPVPMWGGGGTFIKPAIDAAKKVDPNASITIITDGYFLDQDMNDAKAAGAVLDIIDEQYYKQA